MAKRARHVRRWQYSAECWAQGCDWRYLRGGYRPSQEAAARAAGHAASDEHMERDHHGHAVTIMGRWTWEE